MILVEDSLEHLVVVYVLVLVLGCPVHLTHRTVPKDGVHYLTVHGPRCTILYLLQVQLIPPFFLTLNVALIQSNNSVRDTKNAPPIIPKASDDTAILNI